MSYFELETSYCQPRSISFDFKRDCEALTIIFYFETRHGD